jgi:protein ImuB
VPARVTVREGRPVRVQSDRHGVPSGAVLQAAGPWRTSGDWWDLDTARAPGTHHHGGAPGPWDRDEWDVELTGGIVYRIFVERDAGQWFIEGAVD